MAKGGNIPLDRGNCSGEMDSGFDTFATATPPIALALADELNRGMYVLARIYDEAYTRTSEGSGSVGGHYRHNLNFVEAVLNGVKLGRIDYGKRIRDVRIETNRGYAAERFAETISSLRRLSRNEAAKEVSVVSEVNPLVLYRSSVGRELEFAHSHTVHHHALIAQKLHEIGLDASFGVAPSTIRYRKSLQQTEVAEEREIEL